MADRHVPRWDGALRPSASRGLPLDGVDVRLLVPGASDIALLSPFSRSGYRPLLEAGVRVFEWNGPMIHAKTAVADGRWARVGSTNLNIASWMGNRELDVIVEDEPFARQMEQMFLDDLGSSTEVILERNRVRAPRRPAGRRRAAMRRASGSGGRVVAGAARVGNTVAAAISNTRVLESVEANIAVIAGLLIRRTWRCGVHISPPVYPVGVIAFWLAIALLYRGLSLYRRRPRDEHRLAGDSRRRITTR